MSESKEQQEQDLKRFDEMLKRSVTDSQEAKRLRAAFKKGQKQEGKDQAAERKEPKVIYTPTVCTDWFLAEEIWDKQGSPKYLVYYFDKDKFAEKTEIDLGETDAKGCKVTYQPVDNDMLRKGAVIVPTGAVETDFKSVLEEIDKFVLACYDPCGNEEMVKLLSRVNVGSWFMDRFVSDPKLDIAGAGKFAPIIPIRGPSQSGKGRALFCLRLASYRPYYEVSTSRVPSLFRPLDIWRGTLCLEEADNMNSNEYSELAHFLNSRAYGVPYSRQDPNNVKLTNIFQSFGITMLTQRRVFDDNAIESRSLPFYSEKTSKKLPTIETDDMLRMGLALQDKLLWLRFKYYKKIVINKSQWLNEISDHRLMSTMLPLLALNEFEPSIYTGISSMIKKMEELKVREKATSEDGTIVNYLWDKASDKLTDQWNTHYYFLHEIEEIMDLTEEGQESDEPKFVKHVLTTKLMEEDLSWKAKSLRKIIHSLHLVKPDLEKILPPNIRIGKKSYKPIFFEPERFEKSLRDFVIGYKPDNLFNAIGYKPRQTTLDPSRIGSVTSVTTVTSGGKVTDVTHVTDPVRDSKMIKVEIPHPGCPGILHADIYPNDDLDGHAANCDKCGRVETIAKGTSGWIVVHVSNHNGGR